MNFTTEIILTPIETELNITVVELDEEISFDQIDFVVEVQFLEGLQGIPGKQIELGKSSTHLQWRYVGDTAWINLTPLSDITGANGKSCEFQVSPTHIQWRVVGDVDWINLIALSEFKGDKGDDGHTPYIGENGNWWIAGEDTGENAIAPNMSVIEQYVQGYAEPKKGIDDFYVSAAQVNLINDIVNKVTAITGHSLVADTEIAKIHSRNTDSTLLSENGLHSVYIDANGTFHVKNISQVGTTYETHAEQLFTTKNEIILRDGAIAGLGVGEYVGLRAKLYDGVNDGNLVFDKDGFARVGDVGALQKLATIEESPTNGHLMRYNTSTFRLESYDPLLLPVSTAASRAFVSQNGGTIYHITRWFTPTSALTIAANGLSATITSGQFTSAMTGAKLKLTGGVNEPIITYVSSNSITISFAVDSSFFGQSVAIANWGIYERRVELNALKTDKIIPNSDSSGVVIRNAADNADVVKVDTANENTEFYSTSKGFSIVKKTDSTKRLDFRIASDGAVGVFVNNIIKFYFGSTSKVGIEIPRDKAIAFVNPGIAFSSWIKWDDTLQKFSFLKANETDNAAIDVGEITVNSGWVYLNNGTHTGDVLDDYRYKVLSGVLTFQKCTTANSVRGNGGWTTVSTI